MGSGVAIRLCLRCLARADRATGSLDVVDDDLAGHIDVIVGRDYLKVMRVQ